MAVRRASVHVDRNVTHRVQAHRGGLVVVLCIVLAACASGPRPSRTIGGLTIPLSFTECSSASGDADRDNLDDRCELALAQAFAPMLVVDRRDCLWRDDVSPPRLGGGYLFAAQPAPNGVRLAYLPAYFEDCGWSGTACVMRAGVCGAHAGDSEFIVIDVALDANTRSWRTVGVFLSAHCFGRSDGRCRWYRGDELDDFGWADDVTLGAPRVWVARGKHGGYPTRAACDEGHWFYDSCDDNAHAVRFPIVSDGQNIGSRQVPASGGCLTSDRLPVGSRGTVPGTRECFWSQQAAFGGWQSNRRGSAAGSYARYLVSIAGFD